MSATSGDLEKLARSALENGEEDQALPILASALAKQPTARLLQWKALLERALDEHEKALASFREAARLDPNDPSIAHGHARVALEAGLPAERLYERALRLNPSDVSVLAGLSAARLAGGHAEQAEAELDQALSRAPLWIEGHLQLAQLRSMLGHPEQILGSLERALSEQPNQPQLSQALFDLHLKRGEFAVLDEALDRSRRRGLAADLLRPYETIAASELGQTESADRLFAECDSLPIWWIRHLLRAGRAAEALTLIERELAGPGAAEAWSYAAAAWRITGDSRADWLQGDPRLVNVTDLTSTLPPLDVLAETLRRLHFAKGEYLDQSVRGGTQTDGPLLSRIDPVIRQLRTAIVDAVETYVGQLPPIDPQHPLLRHGRDRRIRFSGSWSVRLRDGGFHASHVHPQGWISSALYVALPSDTAGTDSRAGWLQLGQPPAELGTGLEPLSLVKPKPGSLVLFPSWMWHGTFPFPAGERLTVAFDVARPR